MYVHELEYTGVFLFDLSCIKTTITVFVVQVGRLENALGWYHSHPGYGCWLSGIDVSTQMLNQQFQEPWVAIVVSIQTLCPIATVHGYTCTCIPLVLGGSNTYNVSGKSQLRSFQDIPKGNRDFVSIYHDQWVLFNSFVVIQIYWYIGL